MRLHYVILYITTLVLTACATERASQDISRLDEVRREEYTNGKLHVVNDIGRAIPVVAIYDFDYIASQMGERADIKKINKNSILLPQMDELVNDSIILPVRDQFDEMVSLYEKGDLIMYYSLVDSGWALWKRGRIVKCWDVVHSM